MPPYRQYVAELAAALQDLPFDSVERAVDLLHEARIEGRNVFVLGNGGSASTASHMACDLGKAGHAHTDHQVRAMCINDNVPLLTAYANDDGYENALAAHLSHFVRPGDVVVGVSTSGMSMNVILAVDLARRRGATCIALTGASGGELNERVDVCIRVPSDSIERVEDAHLALSHMITRGLYQLSAASEPAAATLRPTPTAESTP